MASAQRTREIRSYQRLTHTTGRMAFAQVAWDMTIRNGGRPLGRGLLYAETHQESRGVLASQESSHHRRAIEERLRENEELQFEPVGSNDLYAQVMGAQERPGRIYGLGMGGRLPNDFVVFRRVKPLVSQEGHIDVQRRLVAAKENHSRLQSTVECLLAFVGMMPGSDMDTVLCTTTSSHGTLQQAPETVATTFHDPTAPSISRRKGRGKGRNCVGASTS